MGSQLVRNPVTRKKVQAGIASVCDVRAYESGCVGVRWPGAGAAQGSHTGPRRLWRPGGTVRNRQSASRPPGLRCSLAREQKDASETASQFSGGVPGSGRVGGGLEPGARKPAPAMGGKWEMGNGPGNGREERPSKWRAARGQRLSGRLRLGIRVVCACPR